MNLAPIGELFRVKQRPETVLEVSSALRDPVETVADYVFTDNLRHEFETIFSRVESDRGQGYWIRAQYGGGKTHFLATLASLLSGSEDVWAAVADESLKTWRWALEGTRLFPVVFSLRGKASVDSSAPLSLYDVFEQEIKVAARDRLGIDLRLSTADEVLQWWQATGEGTRADIDAWARGQTGRSASELLGDHEAFKDIVLDAVAALGLAIRMDVRTEERLQSAYRQIVNPATGYTGILVIIDEFAFWQGQRPENTPEAYADEEFLETIGATLPQARGLQYTVIVASQQPPPVKLQDAARYRQFNIAPGEPATELWEYQQIVSHRVRELRPEREPELDEYYQDTTDRYTFGAKLTPERFRIMFPLEPTTYRILQRITASLSSERVGINVVWEILGEETELGVRVRPELLNRKILINAPCLLDSPSLQIALNEPGNKDRWDFLQAAIEGVGHLDLDEGDRRFALNIVHTLFLWNLAHLNVNTPMPLDELAAAVLAEQGIYNSPRDAVVSVLQQLAGLDQIEFNSRGSTAEFVARAPTGRPGIQIFNSHKARPLTNAEERWRRFLTDTSLAQDGLTALFAGKALGAGEKTTAVWGQVEYEGRQIVANAWRGEFGGTLNWREEGFFRIVYLTDPLSGLGPEALQDDRVAVCVPRDLTDSERVALKDVIILDQMETDSAARDDDEALRAREFVRQTRPERVAELIRRQQEHYRYGRIITRAGLNIDAREVFQQPSADRRAEAIAARLLERAFPNRPFATFRGNAPFAGNNAQFVFQALLRGDTAARARDAAANFAPGLGLSSPEAPTRLTGDHARALNLLRDWLGESSDSGLPVWEIQNRFADLGVPPRLTTLFLLAFVRRASEHAELSLKTNARVTLEGRQGNPARLTSTDIALIMSFTQVAEGTVFDRLAHSRQVSFGEALTWLRAIEDDLRTSDSPDDIAAQERQLLSATQQLASNAEPALDAIHNLGRTLDQAVPAEIVDALHTAAALQTAGNFAEVYERAREDYDDEAAFRRAIEHVRQAEHLALNAGPIQAAVTYLRELNARLTGDLEVERQALLAQFSLDGLLAGSVWTRLQPTYTTFQQRYQTQYRKFHRDYMAVLIELRRQFEQDGRALQALDQLQQVPRLAGAPVGQLRQSWQVLGADLQICSKEPRDVSVEVRPVCTDCGTPYDQGAPAQAVEVLHRHIEEEIDQALRAFKAAAVQQALIEYRARGQGLAATLADAITLGSRQLIDLVIDTPAAIDILRELFREVRLGRLEVGAKLRQRFPTVTMHDLDEVTACFKALLTEALAQAGEGGEVELV